MRTPSILFGVFILLGCVAACGSPQTLHVTAIQLGRSLNADNTVADSATTFGPHDTVYVSVLTAGMGSATISVRWTYAGRVVDEPKRQVSYKDFAGTDFSLKSAGGFPPGPYTAEVFLDGQPSGTAKFQVR